MANTIDIYGDLVTSAMILNGTLDSFEDDGLSVTKTYAFAYQSSLTSVNIPNLTSLGSYSFYRCSSLTSISFPKVNNIGGSSFYRCTTLSSINLPELTVTRGSVFYECRNLINVALPKLEIMESREFSSCSSLYAISLPRINTIGSSAFSSCTSLEILNAPLSTVLFDGFASNCRRLSSFTSYSLHLIGNSAFNGNTSIFTLNLLSPYFMCNLTSVTSLSSTLRTSGTINVRQKFYNQYLTATNWSTLSTITSVPDVDMNPVIFYIDESSDEVVQFYDKNGNILNDIDIGDSPASYTVISPSSNNKPKYYSYYVNDICVDKPWGYYGVTHTYATGESIGSGKTNTATILSITDTTGADSIWNWLKDLNNNSASGYNDWFIPSKDELNELRLFLKSYGDPVNNIIDFISRLDTVSYTSTEWSNTYSTGFYYNNTNYKITEYWNDVYKRNITNNYVNIACAIRSF